MKKLIILLSILTFQLHSQISEISEGPIYREIGSIDPSSDGFNAVLKQKIYKNDTTIIFCFQNDNYSRITDLKFVYFKDVNHTVDSLYLFLKKNINAPNRQILSFNLGETRCEIETFYSALGHQLLFYAKGGFVRIHEKDIETLFGKQNKK